MSVSLVNASHRPEGWVRRVSNVERVNPVGYRVLAALQMRYTHCLALMMAEGLSVSDESRTCGSVRLVLPP